jgi:tetratricopeptide (TPR) repeat protein
MELGPGSVLGPYEVREPLGAGGMGEVWKARDTRLERDVAIKVITHDKADDTMLQSRFGREAKTLSALNHPNIVCVYDVGEQSGAHYIVSELVRGESLRKFVSAGPLPYDRLLNLAGQTARALKAAHAAGIVHRDLKPENIMVTADDTVKILDFGLARHVRQAGASAENSLTQTIATQPGMVMGTAGYMSPEQICGEEVDGRSDIFSFGVILYEMATGNRAFRGRNSIEMMSAVLKDEPRQLPAQAPAALNRVIQRCLEKDPAKRFQTADELSSAIESLHAGPAKSGGTARWVGKGISAAGILLAAGIYWQMTRKPAPQPVPVPAAVAAPPTAAVTTPPTPVPAAPPAPAAAEPVKEPPAPRPKVQPAPKKDAVPKVDEAAYQQAFEQGMLLLSKHRWPKAVESLTEAIRLKPDSAPAYLGRCHAFNAQEQYQKAIDDCTVVVQRQADSADAYHERGVAYFFTDQYDHVVQDMNAAIRLNDPNMAMAYSFRGRAHSNLKEWGAAIPDFDEAIRLKSDMPHFYLFRGMAHNARSEYRKAIEDFDHALSIQPNMPLVYAQRAIAKQHLGDKPGAAADREQAKTHRKQ